MEGGISKGFVPSAVDPAAAAGGSALSNATRTPTAAPSRAGQQSNLGKLLDQQAATGSSAAAKQLALNYVEVTGCTPADGKDLTRMVEGK